MPTDTIVLQDFAAEHLAGAVRLSRAEAWPHRPDDWKLIYGLGGGAVALHEGEVVGTALSVPYGSVGTVGMIIVERKLRGRGLGRVLTERAMALATPREWRLVATAEGLPLYRQLGFVAMGGIAQHHGTLAGVTAPTGVAWAEAADAVEIAALDAAASGADRGRLLAALTACGRIAVLRDGGRIAGYASLRAFGSGEVAGPVVARDPASARRLLAFLFAGRAGGFLRVDTATDSGLSSWLADCGLAPVGEAVAMRRGAARSAPSPFTSFALAAQALG